MRFISLMFKGRNGSGSIALTLPPGLGRLRAKVVHVQQIFSDISEGTVAIADATDSFLSEIDAVSDITQNTSNDYSDYLFLAVLQLP